MKSKTTSPKLVLVSKDIEIIDQSETAIDFRRDKSSAPQPSSVLFLGYTASSPEAETHHLITVIANDSYDLFKAMNGISSNQRELTKSNSDIHPSYLRSLLSFDPEIQEDIEDSVFKGITHTIDTEKNIEPILFGFAVPIGLVKIPHDYPTLVNLDIKNNAIFNLSHARVILADDFEATFLPLLICDSTELSAAYNSLLLQKTLDINALLGDASSPPEVKR